MKLDNGTLILNDGEIVVVRSAEKAGFRSGKLVLSCDFVPAGTNKATNKPYEAFASINLLSAQRKPQQAAAPVAG
jgi:hypothetical protein